MNNFSLFDSQKLLDMDYTDKYLYHYTSLEVGLEHILESGKLRLSPFKNVNDPYEYKVNAELVFVYSGPTKECIEFTKYEKILNKIITENCKVACFSLDNKDLLTNFSKHVNIESGRGYSKPRMWAQYAENHRGMCFIFERKSLADKMKKIIKNHDFLEGRILYDNYGSVENHSYVFNLKNEVNKDIEVLMKKHILENKDDILFKKNEDWSSEQEYRFIIIDDHSEYIYLPYEESLKGIVLGDRFPKTYISCLKKHDCLDVRRIEWNRNKVKIVEVPI